MTMHFSSSEETYLEFCKRWSDLATPYFQWQIQHFLPYLGKRVADVGCGLGNFLPFLKNWELYLGIESEAQLREELRRRHPSPKIKLAAEGDILSSDVVSELQGYHLDSIFCINVLEHIEDDQKAFSHMVQGVAPDGTIGILVPAMPCLYGSLDELSGHFRRYTPRSLMQMAAREKVEILKLYYMNLIGAVGWFLKGKIFKVRRFENEDYRMMNLILPLVSFVESWIKFPLGMSLVMISRKKGR